MKRSWTRGDPIPKSLCKCIRVGIEIEDCPRPQQKPSACQECFQEPGSPPHRGSFGPTLQKTADTVLPRLDFPPHRAHVSESNRGLIAQPPGTWMLPVMTCRIENARCSVCRSPFDPECRCPDKCRPLWCLRRAWPSFRMSLRPDPRDLLAHSGVYFCT